MKFPTFVLSALSLLCCLTHAQDAKKVTFRALFLDRPADAPQKLYLYDGNTSTEINLPKSNLSKVQELGSAGPLKLYLTPSPVTGPATIPAGAPSFTLPEGVRDFYLICISDPLNKVTPVTVKILDVGDDKLRLGETLWYNLTNHTIYGELGTVKLSIKPFSTEVMKSPVAAGEDTYPVSITYKSAENKRTFPICQTVWTHNNSIRWLGFVFQQPGILTPRVMTFRDYRPM